MTRKEKNEIESRKNQIIEALEPFCTQKLDDDYFQLCILLLDKLGKVQDKPLMSGRIEIWAVAILHALGTINFLFDKTFEPYVSIDELNKFYGTSKSTTSNKSRLIRDAFDMDSFNDEYLTDYMLDNHPLNRFEMIDDLIVLKEPLKEVKPREQKIPEPKKVKIKPVDPSQFNLFDELQ
ncbi:MAG: DUF6398 domain-containing protein [Bacteroidota bacterium]